MTEIERRRTFAIIAHPDAGKTSLTEKLLLFGGQIQVAGAVKSNKIKKTATSDWMDIEKQRGISVTTSVMEFDYRDYKINILDTPGHQDFAEDTYRTLTAVDSVIIVVDGAKGVETQTRKLMEVCRMRNTPVIIFINKMDREAKDPFDLLDELEEELKIHVRPLTWPIESGVRFKGVYNIYNGIIENYQELSEKLQKNGYRFYSRTDSEVVVKLIDYYYRKYKMGPIDAINRTLVRVRGTYALCVMFKDYPDEIYVARKDAPIIVGTAEGESYVASDVPAILSYTRKVYYIDNLELARIAPGEVHFYDLNGDEVEKEPVDVPFSEEAARKDGFEHFMMKEIHEQPKVVRDTLHSVVKDGKITLEIPDDVLENIEQLYIVACGSAYHAGMVGQYVIEDLAGVPVRVELASEFRYRKMKLNEKALVVVISQSGETADTLAALRLAKEKGLPVAAIVNVVGSSIAREADYVFYTVAGPEIAVATTKAYSAQLISMYILAIKLALLNHSIDDAAPLLSELETLPSKIEEILKEKERIQWFAAKFAHIRDAFFIGRGIDYAASMEGSLKMKEISYIHSESYADGEYSIVININSSQVWVNQDKNPQGFTMPRLASFFREEIKPEAMQMLSSLYKRKTGGFPYDHDIKKSSAGLKK